MLSFSGSRGPHGPGLPSPFGRKFQLSSRHFYSFDNIAGKEFIQLVYHLGSSWAGAPGGLWCLSTFVAGGT